MEKKYLIGYKNGQPYVIFDNVVNYNVEVDDEGYVHITFSDKDDSFHYKGVEGNFEEVDGKAPNIDDYDYKCRRTVKGIDAKNKITATEYRNRHQRKKDFEDDIRRVEDDPNFVPHTEPYYDDGWYYDGCGGSTCGGGWHRYGGCGFSGC